MKTQLIIAIILLLSFSKEASSQSTISISFDSSQVVKRDRKKDVIYPVYLKSSLGKLKDSTATYTAKVEVDAKATTLPAMFYKLDIPEFTVTELGNEHTGYLTIRADSLADRDRIVVLKLNVYKNNVKLPDSLNIGRGSTTITVKGIDTVTVAVDTL